MSLDASFWLASLSALLVGLSKGGLPTIGMLGVPILSLVMPPMKAAVLLLPYLCWVSIAGLLNWTMIRLNPTAGRA